MDDLDFDLPEGMNQFLDSRTEIELNIYDEMALSITEEEELQTAPIQESTKQLESELKQLAESGTLDTDMEEMCWESLVNLGTECVLNGLDGNGAGAQQVCSLLFLPVAYTGRYSDNDLQALSQKITELPRKLGLIGDNNSFVLSPFSFPVTTATDVSLKMQLLATLAKAVSGLEADTDILSTGADYAESVDSDMTLRTGYFPVLLTGTFAEDDYDAGNEPVIDEIENSVELFQSINEYLAEADNDLMLIRPPVQAPLAIAATEQFKAKTTALLFQTISQKSNEACEVEMARSNEGISVTLKNSQGECIEEQSFSAPTDALAEAIIETVNEGLRE
ncbi:hypothetical protein L3Q72_19690 [Vibrio sp. JC009]|uniref:hypothetical protein n=1 Tax=Vibrio sp. JC009 TaxID=2912314 RepID=UPI0023AE9940|nr:hypothetical protein [Vibrio sp. JC009]WED23465.1 hypothetical protein L3Q72_19690 [Vibrio sp. JC009]